MARRGTAYPERIAIQISRPTAQRVRELGLRYDAPHSLIGRFALEEGLDAAEKRLAAWAKEQDAAGESS